jgi:hypothetical protein
MFSHFVKSIEARGGNLCLENQHLFILDICCHASKKESWAWTFLLCPLIFVMRSSPLAALVSRVSRVNFGAAETYGAGPKRAMLYAKIENLAHQVPISLRRAWTPVTVLVGLKSTSIWPLDTTKMTPI